MTSKLLAIIAVTIGLLISGTATAVQVFMVSDHIRVQKIEKADDPSPEVSGTKKGFVIAKGPGTLDVKNGDQILFSKFAGTEISIEGAEYIILREQDVLGVIEP